MINELDEKPRLHFNDIKPKLAAPGDDQEHPSTLSWYDGAMLADEFQAGAGPQKCPVRGALVREKHADEVVGIETETI